MKKFLLYMLLIHAGGISSLQAQALNEDAALSYYWKNLLSSSRLSNDNGLSKELWIKNQPADWSGASSYDVFSIQPDGAFGQLLFSPNYIPKFSIQSRFSDMGESDLSLRGQLNLKKITTSLVANGQYFNRPIDRNKDLFVDLPTKQRLLFSNTWDINIPNYSSSNRIQYLALKERGGQMSSFGDSSLAGYGTGLNMGHLLVQSQHLIATRKRDLLLIDFKMKDHHQSRNWGLRDYTGREWLVDAQARYEYHLETGLDVFRAGLQYRQQRFNETLDSIQLNRSESALGGFVGYDSYWGKHLLIITHVNILYHNLAGLRVSPNLKINYSPLKSFSVNAFAGNGWRYANPLAEQARYLYSSRQVLLPSKQLLPENAWYYGFAANSSGWVRLGHFPFSQFFVNGTGRFSQHIYTQQVVADVDSDAHQLRFYNLQKGEKAYKLSWGLDLQISWSKPSLTLNIDYRYDRAKTTIGGSLRDLPFYSRHNWLFNLQYACYTPKIRGQNNASVYLFNIQSNWYVQSGQRIPDLSANPSATAYPLQSKAFLRWDIFVELPLYSWIKGHSKWKYIVPFFGFDNLTNNIQSLAFLNNTQPFSPNFDAGMTWNTMLGRRFYGGFRYMFQ